MHYEILPTAPTRYAADCGGGRHSRHAAQAIIPSLRLLSFEVTGSARGTLIYPDHYPRFARLVAGLGNRVWVMAYPPLKEPVWHSDVVIARQYRHTEDGGARWRVVGRDGLVVAEMRTPEGFFLLEVGDDHVLGLHRDELDRESVRLYRLIR